MLFLLVIIIQIWNSLLLCAYLWKAKIWEGLCIHETVMNLKLNYSHPGRDFKKKGRPSFQKSDILKVLNMHNSG